MTAGPNIPESVWRKSTFSNGNGGECVEVADHQDDTRFVRDSKNPTGPVLGFTTAAFAAFVRGARAGEFG